MTYDNIETVRRGVDAFNRGGIDGILPFLDPDVEWQPLPYEPEARTYRRHDGVRALLDPYFEVFESLRMEPEEFIVSGDHVVVPVCVRVRGRDSGVDIEDRHTFVFKLREGTVIEVREYRDRAGALAALGATDRPE